MIGRSHPLSDAKGAVIGLALSLGFFVVALTIALCIAHDKASRGELPSLAREVTP